MCLIVDVFLKLYSAVLEIELMWELSDKPAFSVTPKSLTVVALRNQQGRG